MTQNPENKKSEELMPMPLTSLSIVDQPSMLMAPVDRAMMTAETFAPIFSMGEVQFHKELKMAIVKVITMHGLTSSPTDPEMMLIKKMITTTFKYSRLNMAQFEQAFEFNVAGELDEYIKPFNMFSIDFMCQVLNQYIQKHNESIKDRPKALPPSERPSPEQMEKINRDFKETIIRYFDRYCVDENCVFVNPAHVFCFLEDAGLIIETTERKNEIFEQARKQRIVELETLDKGDPRNVAKTINALVTEMKAGQLPDVEVGMIKTIAREIALREWFKKWKETGFDLTGKLMSS